MESINVTDATASTDLRKNAIGWVSLFFLIIATNGPMTAMAGGVPVAIFLGNGIGLPGSYIVVAMTYIIFAAGFTAMSRYVRNSGAFYAYIGLGLGATPGISAAGMAIFAYNGMLLACYAMIGFFISVGVTSVFHVDLPWWIYASGCALLVHWLCVRGIEFSGKVLLMLLAFELGAVLLADVLVLVRGSHGGGGYDFGSFNLSNVFSNGFGPSLVFVVASYMGFETAAVYSAEVRDPQRSVPLAMNTSIVFIGLIYAVSISIMMNYYGLGQVVERASADPGSMWFAMFGELAGGVAGHVAGIFMITSLFAAILSFTNVLTRYWHALAKTGVVPQALERTHQKHQSPHVASAAQLWMVVVLIGLCALFKLDPMVQVLSWASTPAAIGVVAVQFMTGLAIIKFFQKTPSGFSRVRTQFLPAVATGLLLFLLYQMIVHIDLLVGSDGPGAYLLAASVLVVGGFAAIYAGYIRRSQPQRYKALSAAIEVS